MAGSPAKFAVLLTDGAEQDLASIHDPISESDCVANASSVLDELILEKTVHHGGHGDHEGKTRRYEIREFRPLGAPEFCVLAPFHLDPCALRGANRGV
jgi:toxin ParE1/3/4